MLPGPTCARLMNCCDQLLLDDRFASASNFSHFGSPNYNRLPRAATLLRCAARRPVFELTTVCLT
jgi:hypothetical protein